MNRSIVIQLLLLLAAQKTFAAPPIACRDLNFDDSIIGSTNKSAIEIHKPKTGTHATYFRYLYTQDPFDIERSISLRTRNALLSALSNYKKGLYSWAQGGLRHVEYVERLQKARLKFQADFDRNTIETLTPEMKVGSAVNPHAAQEVQRSEEKVYLVASPAKEPLYFRGGIAGIHGLLISRLNETMGLDLTPHSFPGELNGMKGVFSTAVKGTQIYLENTLNYHEFVDLVQFSFLIELGDGHGGNFAVDHGVTRAFDFGEALDPIDLEGNPYPYLRLNADATDDDDNPDLIGYALPPNYTAGFLAKLEKLTPEHIRSIYASVYPKFEDPEARAIVNSLAESTILRRQVLLEDAKSRPQDIIP